MKRIISLLFALFVTLTAQAQMEVSEFYLAETDLAAREERDVDGELYSIIKIRTESPNLNLNEIDAEAWSQLKGKTVKKERNNRVVEIWVYVRYGETGLKLFYRNSTKEIKFNNLKPGTNIGKGEVYIMNLRSVNDTDEPAQGWLVFNVEPKDASVKLGNDDYLQVSGGTAKKFVSFGTYAYTVECKNYHPQTGSVTLGSGKETIAVRLKPAFGSIRIDGNNGATVYIDNEAKGTAPLTLNEVSSGTYTLRLVKEKYKALTRTVTVRDEETTVFDESMEPNFATLTFTVEGGAEIWINGQKRGTGSVTGDFEAGTLTVETRKANHRNSAPQNISVVANQKRTVALDPPTPIYGSLNIDSEPIGAKVYIDGEYKDETPLFVSRILVGKHTVKMSKDGYADHVADITVEEGKTVSHSATLNNTFPVQLECKVRGASLWIDGESRQFGTTCRLSAGKHTVKVTKNGFRDYNGTIEVENSNTLQIFDVKILTSKDWVDLGLPSGTLWKNENEAGGFYTYDEAVKKFGSSLPTKEQLEELKNKCTWTWNGSGYKVVGPNGNSIVLPAAGWRNCNGSKSYVGSGGDYWSSTPHGSKFGRYLYFYSSEVGMGDDPRCFGFSVRLVQNP